MEFWVKNDLTVCPAAHIWRLSFGLLFYVQPGAGNLGVW